MLKQQNETILMVKELAQCRAFYLDIIENPNLVVNGSFLVLLKSGSDILKLRTENILEPEKSENGNFSFTISSDNVEITKAKLRSYGCVISENKSGTIIETTDIENNRLTIKIKRRIFFSKTNNMEKTQKLTLPI